MSGRVYEVRVDGVIPEESLTELAGLSARVEPATTVLHGPVADDAALRGLLDRLYAFGLEVVEVRRLAGEGADEEAEP